jgi:putative SOS response-associated peptidase YedK
MILCVFVSLWFIFLSGEINMCGRFTLHHSTEEVVERFEIEETLFTLTPRYNIAPSQPIAAIVENSPRRLEGLKWGLVPFWAKDPKIGNKMINARAETLVEKPSFRQALLKRRCIIPSDGFYEWKTVSNGRVPLHIRMRDKRLFGFAGLWEEWKSPEGETLRTCTIITGEPNSLIASIHDRMAVILKPEHESIWLDTSIKDTDKLMRLLLDPYPSEEMEAYQVTRQVNSPGFEAPECIKPITEG